MKNDHENRSIPAGEFKARCLKLMDEVRDQRTEIVITKHGKPVAKLVPVTEAGAPLFGALKGTASIVGDILAPIDTAWEAAEDDGGG